MAKGLPARFEDKRWVAHVDNLDDFFKKYTRISMRKMIDNLDDEKTL